MRAVVYNGPKDVSVDEVADATIEAPTDAIVKITATNICGSDLHMYEGRHQPGTRQGHRPREPRARSSRWDRAW